MLSAQLQCRMRAISVESVQATRNGLYDLLVVKPDHSLCLLTHGLHELPLVLTPNSPNSSLPLRHEVIAVKDGWNSSVTLCFAGDLNLRTSLALICTHELTSQCLLMLAAILPADFFFALHARFLLKWPQSGFSLEEEAFDALVEAIFEVLSISTPPAARPPSDPWSALSSLSSYDRCIDDPILRQMQLPPRIPQTTATSNLPKPHGYIAPVLCGLHYLGQQCMISMRRQHMLAKLVPVICKLALIVRPEWADYWRRLMPDALDLWPAFYQTRE